ncbi:ash family protein, partial [Pectobacterium brasiliense]|nr:ash family protein [Pectobacterium brasiliense]
MAIKRTRQASIFISQPLFASMVAQAGQPSGWPGPTRPVFLPP